jgi:hypothetical protein
MGSWVPATLASLRNNQRRACSLCLGAAYCCFAQFIILAVGLWRCARLSRCYVYADCADAMRLDAGQSCEDVERMPNE